MLTLNIRGADVSIPEAEIERLWLAGVREPAASTTVPGLPEIGSLWNGGVYAGVVRGDAGQRDYHLIANGRTEGKGLSWGNATSWASSLTPYAGRSWILPARRDQAVLYGNLPELFAKEWYWSSTLYAPDAAYAWAQRFGYGHQGRYHHDYEFSARAVLHIPVGE